MKSKKRCMTKKEIAFKLGVSSKTLLGMIKKLSHLLGDTSKTRILSIKQIDILFEHYGGSWEED